MIYAVIIAGMILHEELRVVWAKLGPIFRLMALNQADLADIDGTFKAGELNHIW